LVHFRRHHLDKGLQPIPVDSAIFDRRLTWVDSIAENNSCRSFSALFSVQLNIVLWKPSDMSCDERATGSCLNENHSFPHLGPVRRRRHHFNCTFTCNLDFLQNLKLVCVKLAQIKPSIF
jgi:hypothetical protein